MDFTAYIGIAFNYLDYLKLKVAPDDNKPYFDVFLNDLNYKELNQFKYNSEFLEFTRMELSLKDGNDNEDELNYDYLYDKTILLLNSFLKKKGDEELTEYVHSLLKRDQDLSLFKQMTAFYFAYQSYNMLYWCFSQIGILEMDLDTAFADKWSLDEGSNCNTYVSCFLNEPIFSLEGYDFASAFISSFGDDISKKMFDRVPIILWNLLFPHKNFYMPSGDDGYIYFDLEAGDRFDRISNNELMGFIVMIASGRKVSFDYEGNNYSFYNRTNKPGSVFTLCKNGTKIVSNKNLNKLFMNPYIDGMYLYEIFDDITNVVISERRKIKYEK